MLLNEVAWGSYFLQTFFLKRIKFAFNVILQIPLSYEMELLFFFPSVMIVSTWGKINLNLVKFTTTSIKIQNTFIT